MNDRNNEYIQELDRWYQEKARSFLNEHLGNKVLDLDNGLERIKRLEQIGNEELAICFLGASGVGKSTLINALVAGKELILPSGGIGPLTALAMDVRYDSKQAFEVEYHTVGKLNNLIFALQRSPELKATKGVNVDVSKDLDNDAKRDIELDLSDDQLSIDSYKLTPMQVYRKQAQLLVKGNQDSDADLQYLIDSLCSAAGKGRPCSTKVLPEDEERINRIKSALRTEGKKRFERGGDPDGFDRELSYHASGFLAPLIKALHVRWNSEFLKKGILVVDLPGVGVAGDAHKEETRLWINEKARAVVLVVDTRGITESSADLLRKSHFLQRMMFSADEPSHDPLVLAVAVVHLDDVAENEYAKNRNRRKADHLSDQFDRARSLISAQLKQELNREWDSSDKAIRSTQIEIIERICKDLLVFPLTAPQYRKFLAADPEDAAFINNDVQSGIPAMQQGLIDITAAWKSDVSHRLDESIKAWKDLIEAHINNVRAQWEGNKHTEQELQDLRRDLEIVLGPLQKEFLVRKGSFRQFLKKTMPMEIEALVMHAKDRSRKEMDNYLRDLKDAHWATLRAAVRREGVYVTGRSRTINLPDDLTDKFIEPIADVWGKSIIKEIRKETREFAIDCEKMVIALAEWCREQGARVSPSLLDSQLDLLKAEIKQIDEVGKEILDGLRVLIKDNLSKVIYKPIKIKCNEFVRKGDHIGPGVKVRILELFDNLAESCTDVAAKTARELLLECFKKVENELQQVLKNLENPLENARDGILNAHRNRIEKATSRNRQEVLDRCDDFIRSIPKASSTPPEELVVA